MSKPDRSPVMTSKPVIKSHSPVTEYMTAQERETISKWLDSRDDPFGCLRSARNVCNIEYLVWFVLKQGPILARK